MGLAMNLTAQFLEEHRENEQRLGELARENVDLRGKLERLEKDDRAERDRLLRENSRLRQELEVWKRRYDELARE
jgi:cell shape-determining protein MreC